MTKRINTAAKSRLYTLHRSDDRKIAVSILVGVKTICSAKRDLAGAVGLHFAQG